MNGKVQLDLFQESAAKISKSSKFIAQLHCNNVQMLQTALHF